jgi:methylated-DNA-[protein]-cysteine S-methyltransferase
MRPLRQAEDVELHPFLASCPLCRDRWGRAVDLWERAAGRPDEEEVLGPGTPYAAMLSPFGVVWLARSPAGLCRVELNSDEPAFRSDLERLFGTPRYAPSELADVIGQFSQYFAGQRTEFDLPVDLSTVTPFQALVLRAVAAIPRGEARGYGEIAREVGKPGAARAVGSTMAINPVSIVVPCHRVIRSDGTPGEYGYRSLGPCGTAMKEAMLAAEGIRFGEVRRHGCEPERTPVATLR